MDTGNVSLHGLDRVIQDISVGENPPGSRRRRTFQELRTVVHSSPALISETRPESVTSYERVPFNYMLAGLKALDKRAVPTISAPQRRNLRRFEGFLPPDGLGMTRSTRCYVIVLRKGESFDFSQVLQDDLDTGVLDLELVCQSDWGNLEIAEIAIFVRASLFNSDRTIIHFDLQR